MSNDPLIQTMKDTYGDDIITAHPVLGALVAERDRLRAVAEAARRERDAYTAMPLVPHGERHKAWVMAHRALHAALDVSGDTGEVDDA